MTKVGYMVMRNGRVIGTCPVGWDHACQMADRYMDRGGGGRCTIHECYASTPVPRVVVPLHTDGEEEA